MSNIKGNNFLLQAPSLKDRKLRRASGIKNRHGSHEWKSAWVLPPLSMNVALLLLFCSLSELLFVWLKKQLKYRFFTVSITLKHLLSSLICLLHIYVRTHFVLFD
ncbi:hypothetical protein, unlikely [Trypanosoma brucei gambiense DAL972]|uniref:Uncharacterized protein n=1 Tax=Trypanosoma brucei gambiense (strain MHOM/CI/86/DAL972) TaxID=679716 RepID=D0AAL3_TRYB9|nr:hypothetical protein, unlikely [Trypanosoma brucei gambiense DAL972]CBH18714.1 hypothetical protein, unlikely [Trypanosoma brucei gambiense DAL972]|eukprot:XP_011780978.1 hypothetical protein, unlikely [Trypanosoma brucei gambiense DAL972]